MNVKLIDQRRTADLETPGTPESIQIAQLRYAKGVGVGTVAQANGVTAYVAPALVQERAKASFGTKGVETGHGPSKDAAAAQELSRHLTALFDSPAARDGSLTWSEVVDMATRLKNPSAQWLMDNSDVFKALPTKTGKQGELGIDVAAASAQLSKGLVTPPAQRSTHDARLGQTSEQTATPPKTARQQALDTNAQIERENGELDKEIDKKTKLKDALLKVTTHGLAGDAYLSRQELRDLLQSSDLAQREAAEMVLKQWDQLPVKKYTDWGGGMNTNEMRDAAMKLAGEIDELKARKRELVPVPAEPAATSGSSETNPGKPGGSNRPEAGSGTGDAKRPDQSTTASTGATENYDKIGAFSSKAQSSEGRLADGLTFLQRGQEALQEDLLKAATENPPNQAKIAVIQNKLQQVQNALTAMMQMMKQLQEMMSNMSKMYSEMAMSSIRNMR